MSHFWKNIYKEKENFNTSINKILGNENNTFFWKDRWLIECSFQSQYPLFYDLALNQNITVTQIIDYNRYYLIFIRPLKEILRQ
jgi:hypothetical protein